MTLPALHADAAGVVVPAASIATGTTTPAGSACSAGSVTQVGRRRA